MLAYSSPWLFAVNRVLHRLLAPRHSPCALSSLTLCDPSHSRFSIVASFDAYPIFPSASRPQDGRRLAAVFSLSFFVQFSRCGCAVRTSRTTVASAPFGFLPRTVLGLFSSLPDSLESRYQKPIPLSSWYPTSKRAVPASWTTLASADRRLLPRTALSLSSSVLVEMNGFEPMTPCLQSRCSPS